MLFSSTLTSVLIIFALVLISCFVVARYRDIYEKVKIPLAILTFVGGLIIYTIGYLPEDAVRGGQDAKGTEAVVTVNYESVALRALFSTCRIFVLENDFSEVSKTAKSDDTYVFFFALFHASALIITVLTLLSLFGLRFISKIQLFFAGPAETYVFIGLNEPACQLLKSVRSNGKKRRIIVVESMSKRKEEEYELVKKLRENRCIIIDREPYDTDSLKRLKLPVRFYRRKLNIFLMSEQDKDNVKAAAAIIETLKRDRIPSDKLTLYIQSALEDTGHTLETICSESGISVEYKVFSVPDLVARQLMEICPIIDVLETDTGKAEVKSDFNLFIAGFGPAGVEIFRKCLYSGQFVGGNFKAVITDGAMNSKEGTFNNRYSAVGMNYDVQFVQAEPGSKAFYDVLSEKLDKLNYIVVAIDDDNLCMETAIEIQRLIKRKSLNRPVTLAARISGKAEYYRREKAAAVPNICLFGGLSDIYSESIIINESMDRMARTMNTMFNRLYHAEPADNWTLLDSFTKESNRSAAMNIRTKLKLVGLDMAPKCSTVLQTVNANDYITGERLDNLAKQEHMRWNAFHFASGWITWKLSQTEDALKAKDSANKRHACLVPWDKLKDVTERFQQNPSYEELDFSQVRHIADIIEEAGYTVYKL